MTALRHRDQPGSVAAGLVAILIARTAITGALRGVYPFLPVIARGIDTTLATVGVIVAVRNLAGIAAPAAATLSRRAGRRSTMLFATAAATAGAVMAGAAGGVVLLGVGFVLVGLAKPAFDVAMQAWLAERVPERRRGRVLGAAQLSWAMGLAVTVPVAGVLIGVFGWRVLFALTTAYTVAGAVAVRWLISTDAPGMASRAKQATLRPQRVLLIVILLFNIAFELLLVVYGVWLERDLGFAVAAIGFFTVVVVGAEIVGEGAVTVFSDRVGLRRFFLIGLIGFAVAFAALGLVDSSVVAAVPAVAAVFVMAEITIVSGVPLMTTLSDGGNDRLLGLLAFATSAGRAGGALLAAPLFESTGISGCGLVGGGVAFVAAAVLIAGDRR